MMIVLVIALFVLFVASLAAALYFRSEVRKKDNEIVGLGEEIKHLEERRSVQAKAIKDMKKTRRKQEQRIYDLEEEVSKAHGRLGHFLLDYLESDTYDRDHLDNVRSLFGSNAA